MTTEKATELALTWMVVVVTWLGDNWAAVIGAGIGLAHVWMAHERWRYEVSQRGKDDGSS